MSKRRLITLPGLLLALFAIAPARADTPITHSFLACGGQTKIVGEDGKVVWSYPHASRDGYVLPDGRIILTLSKSRQHPGGAVVEVTRGADGQADATHVIWRGAQTEVNSAQPVGERDAMRFVLTEAGRNPRLLEVDRDGKAHVEFKLDCQKNNAHMETRMVRKLADGTYLAPHLLDFAVKQYDQTGKVLHVIDTTVEGDPQRKIHTWPFTAIRLPDGSTHVNLTHGNRSARFDAEGKIVWQLTNDDLPEPWLADPCGAQVLPNGHIVIASYGQRDPARPRLLEVTPEKKVVWTYTAPGPGVHHFQILTTHGKPIDGAPLK